MNRLALMMASILLICTFGCGSGEEAGVTKSETKPSEAQAQLDSSMTKEQQEQFKQNSAGFNPAKAPK